MNSASHLVMRMGKCIIC